MVEKANEVKYRLFWAAQSDANEILLWLTDKSDFKSKRKVITSSSFTGALVTEMSLN